MYQLKLLTLLTPVAKVAIQTGAIKGGGFWLRTQAAILARRGRALVHI